MFIAGTHNIIMIILEQAIKHNCTLAGNDPHLSKDGNTLEKVQKFACKLATSKWDRNHEELLDFMDLKPLQDKRLASKLGLLFKLVHNLCFFPDNLCMVISY